MSRKNRIVTGAVELAVQPIAQDEQKESYAPKPITQPERVPFLGGGTICPVIAGKQRIIRFSPENGNIYSTRDTDEIKWLDDNGYRRFA